MTNFAHRGIRCLGSNGCRMALPYYCPADHVLRMRPRPSPSADAVGAGAAFTADRVSRHYWRGVMPQLPALQIGRRDGAGVARAAGGL